MKKVLALSVLAAFLLITNVHAQNKNIQVKEVPAKGPDEPIFWLHHTALLKNGPNSVLIKQGQGTLQFTKSGDRFTNVSFKDPSGLVTPLIAVPAGTQGAPKPECKTPLPDACFGTADKNIGLCICKPVDISEGYTFYFLRKLKGRVKYTNIVLKSL